MSEENPCKTVRSDPGGGVKITWTDVPSGQTYVSPLCQNPRSDRQPGEWFCRDINCENCLRERPAELSMELYQEDHAKRWEKQKEVAAELIAEEKVKAAKDGTKILCIVLDPETDGLLE